MIYQIRYFVLSFNFYIFKYSKGPFREPADVQKQRYKPFQPTLRVATDFYSLDIARSKLKDEEWVTRFNDAM